MTEADLDAKTTALYGATPGHLTKRQASDLITLMKEGGEIPSTPAPAPKAPAPAANPAFPEAAPAAAAPAPKAPARPQQQPPQAPVQPHPTVPCARGTECRGDGKVYARQIGQNIITAEANANGNEQISGERLCSKCMAAWEDEQNIPF